MSMAEMRKGSNLSQRQFAELFGIPVRTIQQWEQGKSTPPAYVLDMMRTLLPQKLRRRSEDARHRIPEKTRWRICIDNPFENCDRIHPLQQRKVRELLDDIADNPSVRSVVVFGSSVTQRCHIGSDVDMYVDVEGDGSLAMRPHGFPFDLWTPSMVDGRLKDEIERTGVRVYG
jgi:transcriptional regulator with XRE-family HTH domain